MNKIGICIREPYTELHYCTAVSLISISSIDKTRCLNSFYTVIEIIVIYLPRLGGIGWEKTKNAIYATSCKYAGYNKKIFTILPTFNALPLIGHLAFLKLHRDPPKNVSLRWMLRSIIYQRWSSCKSEESARSLRDGGSCHWHYSQSAFNIIHVAWHVHKTRDATYRLPVVTGGRCLDTQIHIQRRMVLDTFTRCIVRDDDDNDN